MYIIGSCAKVIKVFERCKERSKNNLLFVVDVYSLEGRHLVERLTVDSEPTVLSKDC